jgi:predicted esterase
MVMVLSDVTPVLAHGSGLDELAFVSLPIVIFLTLQWLSRRKARREQDNRGPGTNNPDGQ